MVIRTVFVRFGHGSWQLLAVSHSTSIKGLLGFNSRWRVVTLTRLASCCCHMGTSWLDCYQVQPDLNLCMRSWVWCDLLGDSEPLLDLSCYWIKSCFRSCFGPCHLACFRYVAGQTCHQIDLMVHPEEVTGRTDLILVTANSWSTEASPWILS